MPSSQTPETIQSRFTWSETDLAKFAEFHATNPAIYAALLRFALEAKRAGCKRMGIRMLWERVRWHTAVEAKNDNFSLNNNWHSFYSRLLMQNEPELARFFETRRAKADEAV